MLGLAGAKGTLLFDVPDWLSILVLVLDILTIVFVWSGRKRFLVKVAWTLVVLFLPIVGLVVYFLLGREKG